MTDAANGAPLRAARLVVPDLGRATLTNDGGQGELLDIEPGEHIIEIARLGYETVRAAVEFEAGANVEADIELSVRPVVLDGVTARVQGGSSNRVRWSAYLDRRGFYERERRGIGRQFDRVAIEEGNTRLLSDLFRGIPGLRLIPLRGDYRLVSSRPRNGLGGGSPRRRPRGSGAAIAGVPGGGCPVVLFLDGIRWDGTVDDLPVEWIEGVEVYMGAAQLPPEYALAAEGCGVALFWTN